MKEELTLITKAVPGFHGWSHADKIRFFAWFLHSKLKENRFSGSDIAKCYSVLEIEKPSSISPFLADMGNRKPKELLRDAGGWYMPSTLRDSYESKYGQRAITVEVMKLLKDLPAKVPNVAERDFLGEALICFENGAFRAAIVMTWNLAYSHLLEFILKHHLAAFNNKYQVMFPGKWAKAKAAPVSNYDDFAVDLKESEVLEIAKAANAINNDVYKVLEPKLGRRNSAAHPSSVAIGQLQAEEFIQDLALNVVLKLVI